MVNSRFKFVNPKLTRILNQQALWWRDPLFLGAIFIALLVHGAILSVHFAMPTATNASNKDTAIAINIHSEEVEESDFLAQANQVGSGESEEQKRTEKLFDAQDQEMSDGNQLEQSLERLQQQQEFKFEDKVLMTVLSWQKQAEEKQRKKAEEAFESEYQTRAAMIASLEAQYANRQQDLSKMQNIETVSSNITAKQNASAAYLEKFRQKVETFGNRDYPEQARLQNLAGEVRLMVSLNQRGGIRDIQLIKSSGHDVLDKAAIASVRKAAPFGEFDPAMKKDISELRIIRTWRFDPASSEIGVQASTDKSQDDE